MTKLGEAYKCGVCGNTVEVINPGVGELVCCGQPMGIKPPEMPDEVKMETKKEVESAPAE